MGEKEPGNLRNFLENFGDTFTQPNLNLFSRCSEEGDMNEERMVHNDKTRDSLLVQKVYNYRLLIGNSDHSLQNKTCHCWFCFLLYFVADKVGFREIR